MLTSYSNRTEVIETANVSHNNGSYGNYYTVCVGWRRNSFTCCVAFGNILDGDKRKSNDILRREISGYD